MGNPVNAADLAPELIKEWNGKKVGFCCPPCLEDWAEMTDAQRAEKLANPPEGMAAAKRRGWPFALDALALLRSHFGVHFLKIDGKFFIAGQAAVVHRKNLANTANGEFCGTGQSKYQIVGSEGFQFTNGVNAEKREGLPSLRVVLKHDIKRSVDRDSGSSQSSCTSAVLESTGDRGLADSFLRAAFRSASGTTSAGIASTGIASFNSGGTLAGGAGVWAMAGAGAGDGAIAAVTGGGVVFAAVAAGF
jgi:hypothetical protein